MKTAKNLLVAALVCAASFATGAALAATNFSYNFDNYLNGSTPPGMQLVGNAVITDDTGGGFTDQRLRLTFSGGGQQGSGWRNTTSNVSQSFDTTFTFQISFLGGGGADGFSFNVQNLGSGINTGEAGPGSGSLSVSFDTWNNGGTDPSDNFVRIFSNGAAVATSDLNGVGINLSDSGTHTARVIYSPNNLNLIIDGNTVLSNVGVTLSSSNGLVSGTGSAYVGFGARTGGATENHDIKTWSFTGNQNAPTVASNGPYVYSASQLTSTLNSTGSSDAEGALANYSWQVAGGGTFIGASPTISIVQTGLTGTTSTNTVTLTVTDSDGATAASNSSFSYTNAAPTANAGPSLAFSAGSPTVTANGSVTDADLAVNSQISGFETTAYSWGYGNAPSSASNPVTLAQAIANGLTTTIGSANLPLTVTDKAGASANSSTVLTYTNSAPTANAGGPLSFSAGNTTVTANGSVIDADLANNGLISGFETSSFSWGYGNSPTAASTPVTLSQAIANGLTSTTGTANLPLTVTDQAGAASSSSTTLSYTNSGPTVNSVSTVAAPNYGITFGGQFGDADLFANGLTASFENLIFEFDLTQATSAAQVGDGLMVGSTSASQTTPGTLGGTYSLTQLISLFGGLGTHTAWANVRDAAGAFQSVSFQVNVVPEPASLVIWTALGALAAVIGYRRRRAR